MQTSDFTIQMNSVPSEPEIILASASSSRKALLERLSIPFACLRADIDETPGEGEAPGRLVEWLSKEKALEISRGHTTAFVIGSDQVAVHNGRIWGKPGSREAAEQALSRFSGDEVTFLTGVCVVNQQRGFYEYHFDETLVVFRLLEAREITRYVRHDRPLDCAGSFRVESLGPALFEAVKSSDPTALLGLPLIGTARLLRNAGFRIP